MSNQLTDVGRRGGGAGMTKGWTMGILEGYLNFDYQSARNSKHPSQVIIASKLSKQPFKSEINWSMHHVFVLYICGIHIHMIHIVDTGWAMLESYRLEEGEERRGCVELDTWSPPWLVTMDVCEECVDTFYEHCMRTNKSEECRARGYFISPQWLVRGDVGLVWE